MAQVADLLNTSGLGALLSAVPIVGALVLLHQLSLFRDFLYVLLLALTPSGSAARQHVEQAAKQDIELRAAKKKIEPGPALPCQLTRPSNVSGSESSPGSSAAEDSSQVPLRRS